MKRIIIVVIVVVINNLAVSAQEMTKQEKGYFNLTELGLSFGNNSFEYQISPNKYGGGTDGAYSISLRNINGLFLTHKIALGIGVGLENYTHNDNSTNYNNLFQLFIDTRYYFKNKANTFFAYGDVGTSAKIADNFSKGTMFNLGIGYKFKVAKKTAMIGSFGYNDQTINRETFVTKNRYYGVAFHAGLLF